MADVRYFLADPTNSVLRFVVSAKGVPDEILLLALIDILGETDPEIWNTLLDPDQFSVKDGLWEQIYNRTFDLVQKSINVKVLKDFSGRGDGWRSTTFSKSSGLKDKSCEGRQQGNISGFVDLTRTGKFIGFNNKLPTQFLTTSQKAAYLKTIENRLSWPGVRGYIALLIVKLNECLETSKQIKDEDLLNSEDWNLVDAVLGQSTEFGLSQWNKKLKLPVELLKKFPGAIGYKNQNELEDRQDPPSVVKFVFHGRTIPQIGPLDQFPFPQRLKGTLAKSVVSSKGFHRSPLRRTSQNSRKSSHRDDDKSQVSQVSTLSSKSEHEAMTRQIEAEEGEADLFVSFKNSLSLKEQKLEELKKKREHHAKKITEHQKMYNELDNEIAMLTSGMQNIETEGVKCMSSLNLGNTVSEIAEQMAQSFQSTEMNQHMLHASNLVKVNKLLRTDVVFRRKMEDICVASANVVLTPGDIPNLKPDSNSSTNLMPKIPIATLVPLPKPNPKPKRLSSSSSSDVCEPECSPKNVQKKSKHQEIYATSESSMYSASGSESEGNGEAYKSAFEMKKKTDDGEVEVPARCPSKSGLPPFETQPKRNIPKNFQSKTGAPKMFPKKRILTDIDLFGAETVTKFQKINTTGGGGTKPAAQKPPKNDKTCTTVLSKRQQTSLESGPAKAAKKIRPYRADQLGMSSNSEEGSSSQLKEIAKASNETSKQTETETVKHVEPLEKEPEAATDGTAKISMEGTFTSGRCSDDQVDEVEVAVNTLCDIMDQIDDNPHTDTESLLSVQFGASQDL